MRLHSLILAAAAGVPSVGISYDPKVQSFITSLGQIGAGNADCTGYEELHRAVWELLDNYHQKRQLLQEKLPSLRERTRKDIQAVLSLL